MLKPVTLILLFSVSAFIMQAQNESSNVFLLNFGLALSSTKETHYSSNFRNGIGYTVKLGFEKRTLKAIHRFQTSFLQAAQGKENISYSNLLNPEIRYDFLKVTNKNAVRLGGYLDAGTLLNFRRGAWADENSINYTIWSSLGVVVEYEKNLLLKGTELKWNINFSLPICSYLIRPSYTFPYPDNYLEDNTFNFDRSGLGGKIVTGGDLVTLDKFINLQFRTGLNLPIENIKWVFGIEYAYNYKQTDELKPMFQSIHALSFVANF